VFILIWTVAHVTHAHTPTHSL